MGRKKTQKNPLPRGFVPLTWDLLNSEAYKALNLPGVKALPFFIGKARYERNIDCNVRSSPFQLSYSEIQKCTRLSRTAVSHAVVDLVAKGFIDVIERGYRTDYGGRHSSKYAMSGRWQGYGKLGFELVDLRKIEPKKV